MKQFLGKKIRSIRKIEKLKGEASEREFFRLFLDTGTLIAMVYPEENPAEISKVVYFSELYQKYNIRIPAIIDVFEERAIIQEDLGNELVQHKLLKSGTGEIRKIIDSVADILIKLGSIPPGSTEFTLDKDRMKGEMDFFTEHFIREFFPETPYSENIREEIHGLVDEIQVDNIFSHRDYHSRNMLIHHGEVCLVDIQDSLQGPEFYDLVSFAYDSYQNLHSHRRYLFKRLESMGLMLNEHQIYLVALQRNIKALGTFGFQVQVKNNRTYKKYMNPTIQYIRSNELSLKYVPSLTALLG
jgi:aminoglycoside/choline kinase family phosphotransferase